MSAHCVVIAQEHINSCQLTACILMSPHTLSFNQLVAAGYHSAAAAATGVWRPRDDLRRLNEQLCWECESAREQHRRLKETVDNLKREYEASKDVDVFRRYKLLKGMIKRSVTHVRLRTDEGAGQTLSTAKQRQEMKRNEEQVTGIE